MSAQGARGTNQSHRAPVGGRPSCGGGVPSCWGGGLPRDAARHVKFGGREDLTLGSVPRVGGQDLLLGRGSLLWGGGGLLLGRRAFSWRPPVVEVVFCIASFFGGEWTSPVGERKGVPPVGESASECLRAVGLASMLFSRGMDVQ